MHARAAFAALASGLLLLTVFAVAAAPDGAAGPARLPLRVTTSVLLPAGNTSINDDLTLNATPPAGSYAPGSLVQVAYRVTVVSAAGASNASVFVPQLLAFFAAAPSSVSIFLPAHELNASVGGTATAPVGQFTLRNATSFDGTRLAGLNSELVSLMGSLPFGDLAITAQWNWTITASDGSSTSSGWGPSDPSVIHPAEIAYLENLTPRQLVTPAPVTACLSGPLQERTFSLHAETPSPVDDFVGTEVRDPVGGPSTECLTVVIPTNITPQTILMHVWDYETVTLLLYIVKVKILNGTAGTGGGGLPGNWSEYANAAIGIAALGVVAGVVLAVRREPASPPPPGPPVGPPPGADLDRARSPSPPADDGGPAPLRPVRQSDETSE